MAFSEAYRRYMMGQYCYDSGSTNKLCCFVLQVLLALTGSQ